MDIEVPRSSVAGTLRPPSSKSYAQRAIAAALLSPHRTRIGSLKLCDDTRSALATATALGARIESEGDLYTIHGGLKPLSSSLDIGESGLAARLFTPIASLGNTPITITGHGSILQRPMGMMLDPLRALGVKVADNKGLLPISVCGPMGGGQVEVDGSVSSQFLTGLLIALPLAGQETLLKVERLQSTPYIDMTLDVMRRFGVRVEHRDHREFFVPGGQEYRCGEFIVEGDWSAASCLLVAGATAGAITLENLDPLSLQADVAMIEALMSAGARVTTQGDSVSVEQAELTAFEFDATHCPDLFPALAALAANCLGVSEIRGAQRLIHKESNRALALQNEYAKLGILIQIDQDTMRITGGRIAGGEVESHGDHRIAMSLAVAGLRASSPVTIHDAQVVAKSHPLFWDDLKKVMR